MVKHWLGQDNGVRLHPSRTPSWLVSMLVQLCPLNMVAAVIADVELIVSKTKGEAENRTSGSKQRKTSTVTVFHAVLCCEM